MEADRSKFKVISQLSSKFKVSLGYLRPNKTKSPAHRSRTLTKAHGGGAD